VAVALLGAACSSSREPDPPAVQDRPVGSADRQLQDELDRLLASTLKERYACTTLVAAEPDAARDVRVFLTTGGARATAEELLEREVPSYRAWTISVVAPHFSRRARERLFDDVSRTIPLTPSISPEPGLVVEGDPANALVARGDPFEVEHCPRVVVGIEPEGVAHAELEAWADGLLEEYGEDRVVIRRFEGHDLDNAG